MAFFADVGRRVAEGAETFAGVCAFTGETLCSFVSLAAHPRRFRAGDFALAFQRASFDGLPISCGIGLLLGVILAFESAAALKTFGAEVYVSDLLSLGLFRELGPLVTAIILAGRSGGAYAAEIGTMKTDEELDALYTMGLPPVQFLVPPRILASVLAMPVLTVFAEIAGLAGGAAVLAAMGVPPSVFWERAVSSVDAFTVAFGLAKACLFGFLAASVGCCAGMRTRPTSDGVGVAATSAVVGGIVAIAIADGVVAVLCYIWGV